MKPTTVLTVVSLVVLPTVAGAQGSAPQDTVAQGVNKSSLANGSTASAEACTKLRAYVKHVFEDSINALRKSGKLTPTGKLEIGTPKNMPDSIQSLIGSAGQSCQPIDAPTFIKLIESTLADTAGKPRQP